MAERSAAEKREAKLRVKKFEFYIFDASRFYAALHVLSFALLSYFE
jgi:hypothetical protein